MYFLCQSGLVGIQSMHVLNLQKLTIVLIETFQKLKPKHHSLFWKAKRFGSSKMYLCISNENNKIYLNFGLLKTQQKGIKIDFS